MKTEQTNIADLFMIDFDAHPNGRKRRGVLRQDYKDTHRWLASLDHDAVFMFFGTYNIGKRMISTYGERCFWVKDGPILGNLMDLHDALVHMQDEQFNHHVSRKHNHFADWMSDVLGDDWCADGMRFVRTRRVATRYIKRVLDESIVI